MVQRIDLTGEVFHMLKENNLMIEESQHSNTDQNGRHEEWMLSDDVPDGWSNYIVNISDQPDRKGYPILGPIGQVLDEEEREYVFRFPTNWEMGAQQIEELIKAHGTDALAWYRPFHMDPQERWGITILDRGIWFLARKLARDIYGEEGSYTADQILNCRDIAKNFLYHHEMFHFKVELAATMMEINRPGVQIYARYWGPNRDDEWFGSPSEVLRGYAPLEEALANSYALEKVVSEYANPMRNTIRKAINRFMKSQPDGYKHASKVTGKHTKWKQGISELIDKILNDDGGDDLSPQRILASHVLFDGYYGREDWIEEYYAGIVPCRILDTGFADGRFSKSTDPFKWRDFCLSSYFWNGWGSIKSNDVLIDMQLACNEFTKGFGEFRKKASRRAGLWDRVKGEKVMYFRICSQKYRVYHRKWNGQEVLLAIHAKDGDKTPKKVADHIRKRYSGPVKFHNNNCHEQ